MRKKQPAKEGWYTKHPLTLKRVEVVNADWAFTEIAALREALQSAKTALYLAHHPCGVPGGEAFVKRCHIADATAAVNAALRRDGWEG